MCEMSIVYDCDKRKARKEHKCCECRGVIQVGETYNYHHGIWSDGPEQYKTCLECEVLRDDIDMELNKNSCYRGESTPFGSLYESIFEVRTLEVVSRFLNIKRKRGAKIEEWMLQREATLATDAAVDKKG